MSSPRFWRLYLLFLLAVFTSFSAWASSVAIGSAYDMSSGDFLYREHHACREDTRYCVVEYRDTSGSLIARKQLDFSASPFRPALLLRDYRRDVEQQIPVQAREDLVVDAGFDNFIRSRWSALEQGESVRFSFLVAGQSKPLEMLARQDDSGQCAAQELCLLVSLDSWFLGLLVDPVGLSYSRQDRRLLRYQGPSNISGGNGESISVVIHYQYGDSFPVGASQSAPRDTSAAFEADAGQRL